MKTKLFIAAAILLPYVCAGQSIPEDNLSHLTIDSTVVTAMRAGARTPVSYSQMDKEQLDKLSPINSLPMALSLMPSVVSSNEGGTGLGYSKFRVRGSDPSRTNINLNGIALNDAESQEVFWVNIVSIAGMLNSAQMQRGVGTSTVGSGNFGASLNMQTALPEDKPSVEIDLSGGSFRTAILNTSIASGRLPGGLSFNVKYNYANTQGYTRNAYAQLNSMLASGSWYKGNNLLKLNFLHGQQHSGITWDGISLEQMTTDRRYNPAGEYVDSKGNISYYDNESDNFNQNHFQIIDIASLSDVLSLSTTLNYTSGRGFYENYKDREQDYVSRQYGNSNYYAAVANLKLKEDNLVAILNLSYSAYDGQHLGEVIWRENKGSVNENPWYENDALKQDFSAFLRAETDITDRLNIYGDLQYRHINYLMEGPDDDQTILNGRHIYDFFNPKFGGSFAFSQHANIYASIAVGHKEPGRGDIKDAIKMEKDLKPEQMTDYEMGYRYESENFSASAAAYFMEYDNQLVTTGKLSSTGYMIKDNVRISYRRGVELVAAYSPALWVRIDANAAFSGNKIVFEEGLKKLAMSPSAVVSAVTSFTPIPQLTLATTFKYVGKQYIDNTQSEQRSLPAYFLLSQSLSYSFRKNIKISIFADNLLNKLYVADAWAYGEDIGYYPQAPRNYMIRLSFNF